MTKSEYINQIDSRKDFLVFKERLDIFRELAKYDELDLDEDLCHLLARFSIFGRQALMRTHESLVRFYRHLDRKPTYKEAYSFFKTTIDEAILSKEISTRFLELKPYG